MTATGILLLVIYFLGVIVMFVLCKHLRNKENDNTWGDVIITVVLSFLSWGGFLLLALSQIKIKIKIPPKPPKYL